MIGYLAGDIIASPFIRKRPASLFFGLFDTVTDIEVKNSKRVVERTYEAKPTEVSRAALAFVTWLRSDASEREAMPLATLFESFGVEADARLYPVLCAVAGEEAFRSGSGSYESGVVAAAAACDVAGDDMRLAGAHIAEAVLSMYKDPKKDIILENAPESFLSDGEALSRLVEGTVALQGNGLVEGDGLFHPEYLLYAAGRAVEAARSRTGSFEEAVRLAALTGGKYGTSVAALAGALAEAVWPVEEIISVRTKDYFDKDIKELIQRFEKRGGVAKEAGTAVGPKVYSMANAGNTLVFFIPGGDAEALEAVRNRAADGRKDVLVISPENKESALKALNIQRDAEGLVLADAFIERDRVSALDVWLEDGVFVSSSSRMFTDEDRAKAEERGHALPGLSTRQKIYSEWKSFVDYCRSVRSKLDGLLVPGGCPDGKHVHFSQAIYPDVASKGVPRVVRLMRGDQCMGAVGLTDRGTVRKMPQYLTVEGHKEYAESAFEARDLFTFDSSVVGGKQTQLEKSKITGPSLEDFKAKVGEHCLDEGFGAFLDEQVQADLNNGGEDRENALSSPFNQSNEQRVYKDAGTDLPEAVALDVRTELERAGIGYELIASASKTESVTLGPAAAKLHNGSVFTVGCSNMTAERLQGLLKTYGIEVVVDVRSFPQSDYAPQFDGPSFKQRKAGDVEDTPIAKLCAAAGVDYEDFGDVLGDHPRVWVGKSEENPSGWRNLTFDETLASQTFKDNIANIRGAARDGVRMALLGAEGDPFRSMRFAQLGFALSHPSDGRVKPLDVQHIKSNGLLVSQERMERKVVEAYKGAMESVEDVVSDKKRLAEMMSRYGESVRTKEKYHLNNAAEVGARSQKTEKARRSKGMK